MRSKTAPSLIYRLNILSCAIAIAMLVLVGFGQWQARQDALSGAASASTNLVAALSRTVADNVGLADRAVLDTRAGLQIGDLQAYPREIRQFILFGKGQASPYIGRVFILDDKGRLIAESSGALTVGGDFSDRSYFRYWALHDGDIPYISAPLLSRLPDDTEAVVLSRRVDHDGRFAGVVAVTLPLWRLQRSFSIVDAGYNGAINLFTLDGTILARNSGIVSGARHNIGGAPTFERIKRERRGTFVGRSAIDGEERLYSFDRTGRYPFIVDVAVSTDTILEPWRRRALPSILATLALCAGIIMLAILFRRELLRRESVEAKLADLAATDALTGLLNRRSFDTALEREWRRSNRTGSSLALLMIDVDHFKAYNDRYGHVAGDLALQRIAALLRAAARRDADQTVRLGGEEFAILMPDTNLSGGIACARRLLDLIAEAKIEHDSAPASFLSVSIGVAERTASDGNGQALVKSADQALYRAKGAGRGNFATLAQD